MLLTEAIVTKFFVHNGYLFFLPKANGDTGFSMLVDCSVRRKSKFTNVCCESWLVQCRNTLACRGRVDFIFCCLNQTESHVSFNWFFIEWFNLDLWWSRHLAAGNF